jgi:hypothetical protein
MLEVSRSYSSITSMMSMTDQLRKSALDKLAEVSA